MLSFWEFWWVSNAVHGLPQLPLCHSINLLHLRCFISSALNLLERWEVIIVTEALVVIVNAEPELDHAVNAASKLRRFVKIEARSQERRIEQEPDQVLDRLVGFVGRSLLLQLRHDGMLRIHFHGLLRHHVRSHAAIAQSLRLHYALHIGRPSILRGCKDTRGVRQSRTNQNLFDLVAENLFHKFGQGLKLSL